MIPQPFFLKKRYEELFSYPLPTNNFYCLLNRLAVTIDLEYPFRPRRVMNTYRIAGRITDTL